MIKAPVLPPLPAPQLAKLMNCSAEERRTMLAAFDSETRGKIFAAAPPQLLDGLPDDLKQEARKVRQAEEQSRQKELRRLMPPLNELLSPEQIQTINHGTPPEKVALINSFDPEKRLQILHAVALQPLMDETRNQ